MRTPSINPPAARKASTRKNIPLGSKTPLGHPSSTGRRKSTPNATTHGSELQPSTPRPPATPRPVPVNSRVPQPERLDHVRHTPVPYGYGASTPAHSSSTTAPQPTSTGLESSVTSSNRNNGFEMTEDEDNNINPNLDNNISPNEAQDGGDCLIDEEDGEGEEGEASEIDSPFSDLSKEDISHYARIFARLGGVFSAVGDIAETGNSWESDCRKWVSRRNRLHANMSELDSEASAPSDDDDDDPRDLSLYKNEFRHKLEGWLILCNIVPNFREGVRHYVARGHSVKRLGLCTALQKGIGVCRGNDTSDIKQNCIKYVNLGFERIDPPLPTDDEESKKFRGWAHPTLAAMLLPLKYAITDDNINSATTRDGKVETHHDIFPRWLYPHDQVYVPKDENEGLFKGYFLIRVLRNLYTGYRSVRNGPDKISKRSRAQNAAQRMGVSELTVRMIAYGCCQAQFAINNQGRWDESYYDFDLKDFYWNVVELLSTGDEGAKAVAFLNNQVFGVAVPEHARLSGSERLLAQRTQVV
ncbi:hypothetical protein QCA50_005429 [Cerrena zonata]|uniref:Uncharacterized protein n=1 Tax=Cerrena zonata TaxID=2478898 RepID=A0AAW0GJR7_9APHY